jgi:hypothetical protein
MITPTDRKTLYRYASTLPRGEERTLIMAGLKKASLNKKAIAAILSRKRKLMRGPGRSAAVRLAASMPKGSDERKIILAGLQKSAPTFVRVASNVLAAEKWVEVALTELGVELDLEEDDFKVRGKTPWGHGVNVEGRRGNNGESEWMLFKDDGDAYDEAYDYVKDMLEDEPEVFNQDWLEHYMSISPLDARQIGVDEADSRIEDMSDEEKLETADLEDKWQDLEDEKDEIEYGDARDAEDADDAALDRRVAEIEKAQAKMVDEARDEALSSISEEVETQLNRDPLGWYRDMTGERDIPSWMSVDVEKAAKAALREDGVAHFLDRYDGDYVELASGAEAYGTN